MRRRSFLKTALNVTAAAAAGTGAMAALTRGGVHAASDSAAPTVAFPDGFLWGVSTSSYQIEGAVAEDGRGPSVWDTFSHSYGRIANGDTGDVACDHYHRYAEDVELMARAGMRAYRFSIAWPRILPTGTGAVNAKGLDFYDRLTDALLAKGIQPWPCLFHWDLPQALQDRGGWTNRDIAGWFTDYALAVTARLGDRAKHWVMLNEPSVVAIFGHGTGGHAPGMTGRDNCLKAIHHQNLAQGTALAALRQAGGKNWQLGTVLSLQPSWPVGGLDSNYQASLMWDAVWNRSCLDPLFKGRFPELLEAEFTRIAEPGDLERIRQPVDFLGINYYSRMHQQPDPHGLFGTGYGSAPEGTRRTGMDWPVEPDGLTEILAELQEKYGNPPVYVAENGAAYPDTVVDSSGRVEDRDRIAYLRDHLLAAAKAIDEGCNLKGYLAWTLLDNFEWAEGYRRKFGLIQVDRETMARKPKASYDWYASVIRNNAVPLR
ncbi:GH1 family beta-glucosidase [Azospirillum ramasamyi]|uniref:Beta-glucosidase n=1 Tax=Azospirillum ramasamyi TaxID=682998 RepID=A0A2U9SDA2_9PROT|nr:GH1 family beta-glucosidase [Azospirillum ramasamyi]AWU97555.1 beta-glucosidase [Azospirillum ramasamyi]